MIYVPVHILPDFDFFPAHVSGRHQRNSAPSNITMTLTVTPASEASASEIRTLIAALRKTCIFQHASEASLFRLAMEMERVQFSPGDTLGPREGEPQSSLFVVTAGRLARRTQGRLVYESVEDATPLSLGEAEELTSDSTAKAASGSTSISSGSSASSAVVRVPAASSSSSSSAQHTHIHIQQPTVVRALPAGADGRKSRPSISCVPISLVWSRRSPRSSVPKVCPSTALPSKPHA